MAIQQVVKGRMETLNRFKNFSYGTCAVVLLIGSLVVLVTMMGSVRERTSEIGILRAIGFRKSHIMKIILMEVGIISILAGLFGYAAGLGGTQAVFKFFINKDIMVPTSLALFTGSTGLAFVIGILAGAYPALMASKLDPNDALRAL